MGFCSTELSTTNQDEILWPTKITLTFAAQSRRQLWKIGKKRPATPVGEKLEDCNKWDRGKGLGGLIWGRKQNRECDENRREMVKQCVR